MRRYRVPFVDIRRQVQRLEPDLLGAIEELIREGQFIGGDAVASFESAFVSALGLVDGVGCSSGTSALSLALEAAGVTRGDEVITSAHTFFATAEAICHVGATPVFVDIDPGTYCIDPRATASAVTSRTAAIVPVHLYGNVADMDSLRAVADQASLLVIEDAAQAHMATYKGAPVGTLGDAAAFSFYPGKNLGAFGDAGFVSTENPDWLQTIKMLADHGRRSKYEHEIIGYNHRLDALQAVVLAVKLPHLGAWTNHRRAMAAEYDKRLVPRGIKVIEATDGARPVYHLYVAEVGNREEVMNALTGRGIASGIHYPVPLHLQPALAFLGYRRGELPHTEHAADRVLSLPLDGELPLSVVDEVCSVLDEVARP